MASVPGKYLGNDLVAQRLLSQIIARGAQRTGRQRLLPGHRIVSGMSLIIGAKETTVKGFLIFSGTLAMLVGLVAMIEGHLHCLGFLRRKKGRP